VRILVADDNLFYRAMLEAALREWGYDVITAADGEEAWLYLQHKEAAPLAILDWRMPRLDGLELCRRLRAAPRPQPTYLILLAARGDKEDLVAVLESGADDYLRKPFDRDELRARVQVGLRMVGLQASLAERVQQLQEALSAAQKLETMGQLAGGVAHDFNNLLTVIVGGCDLLLARTREDAEKNALAQMILKAGQRGAALTRQLLAFGRGQVLAPAVHNLNRIVGGALELLRRMVPEDIALVTVLDPALRSVRADAGQIEQVLMNLVVNARDAMPGGGTITLRTGNVELAEPAHGVPGSVPPGMHVRCQVSDTGCGMSEEIRVRVFEPFFTTKEPPRGTGLGLATVYGIVKQSGGYIQVESAPTQGTVFSIFLPMVADAETPAPAPRQPMPQQGGRQTILLVEDEPAVRAIARRILKDDCYTVLEAGDGEEALQVSRQWAEPIHLLLTDVVMPRMNGRQLVDRIVPERPAMRVLFMSGYTAEVILERATHEETAPFLEKPFTPDTLVSKVREVLEQGSAGGRL
jgi:signal transduction histidine kinase